MSQKRISPVRRDNGGTGPGTARQVEHKVAVTRVAAQSVAKAKSASNLVDTAATVRGGYWRA